MVAECQTIPSVLVQKSRYDSGGVRVKWETE